MAADTGSYFRLKAAPRHCHCWAPSLSNIWLEMEFPPPHEFCGAPLVLYNLLIPKWPSVQEFSKEVDAKSSQKSAVLSTGNQLLRLKKVDTAALRAGLSQIDNQWTELLTQIPLVQEKLHQVWQIMGVILFEPLISDTECNSKYICADANWHLWEASRFFKQDFCTLIYKDFI